jgi:carbonic anhydrase
MRNSISIFSSLAIALFAGCSKSPEKKPDALTLEPHPKTSSQATSNTESHHYFHKEEKPHAAAWGYSGDTGPSHWGELDGRYSLAKTGQQQSPIDLTNAIKETLPTIQFDYFPSKIDLVYNGHTVEEIEDKASSITVDGDQFVLQQFHFHSPSEHTIDGKHSDMEMHLVHKSEDGRIAVIGVMINSGSDNAAYDAVWNYLPSATNRERKEAVQIDASTLLPESRDYFRYSGSFTTPPCTEGVLWMVLQNDVELSQNQIDRFRKIIDANNRPVQPLNDRQIDSSK